MKLSLGENYLRQLVEKHHPGQEILHNIRPSWLKNPKTGRPLELDIFLPHLKIAYEFQGGFHKKFYQSFKDRIKKELCEKEGVELKVLWGAQLIKFIRHFKIPIKNKTLKKINIYSRKFKKGKGNKHGIRKAEQYINEKRYSEAQEKEKEFELYKKKYRLKQPVISLY